MSNKPKLLSPILLLLTHLSFASASTVCGYTGPIAKQVEATFDKCYIDNVKESRLRMALGYEHCLGANYAILNSTVAGPYNKKTSDTQSIMLHLSDSVCSDNEDALNEFIINSDSSFSPGDNDFEPKIQPTDENIRNCKSFFDSVIHAIGIDNFEIASLMKNTENQLSPQFPDQSFRDKVFLVVVNIVKPQANCYQPMLELRMRLIKKYLKRFLTDQISPLVPSFSGKTLPVVSHPEIFIAQQAVTQTVRIQDSKFNWNQKPTMGLVVAPERIVKMAARVQHQVSADEKARLFAFDATNTNKSLSERDNNLKNAVESGSVTQTQVLSMTPKEQFDAGLIDRTQLRSQVFKDEDHMHRSGSVEIDDIWNSGLSLKKKHFTEEDFGRYKIKGFDVDKKIEELFKV